MALLLGPEPIVDAQPWYPPKLQEFAPAEALAAGLVCQADAVEIGYTTEADAGTTADDPGRSLSIVSLDRFRQAIRDPDLDRGHLKVLANLSERFNATTLTAWPSRERIGEEEGLDPKSVANKLYDLKRRGYIDWGRLPDPKKSRRTLVHYWWLQDEIAAAVTTIREKIDAQSARPAGQQKCPPERASAKSARPSGKESARSAGLESARPAGNKELSLAGTHLAEENTPPSPRKRRAKRGRKYLFEEIIQ